ncbi:PilZ domain-containing protein [Dissulfurirhabdus thermomarina]|uniref:PilZ domain-containing protein n=1 Tax=Dissulfurirhabdus thermomarina TaxID=1765737 RepID=A0A6N9TMT7_DISTH|nr:PilZ domain-containing protein [Dissulfurirhabdus thermomarina]NDY42592.1 PilZ domain-containing protein [Dissulfurirhabdus thermomarina]NMX24482.1 PilZ domain-containing protein [Dissulfurirhabdus thermomarina]
MPERRKMPRYPLQLRVYMPEFDRWGRTSDVSIEGCHIHIDAPVSEGHVTDFMIELPVVGTVCLQGYVQHHNPGEGGFGMQFVQVRFAEEQGEFYTIFANFLKCVPHLEKIREYYDRLVETGRLRRCLPPGGEGAAGG